MRTPARGSILIGDEGGPVTRWAAVAVVTGAVLLAGCQSANNATAPLPHSTASPATSSGPSPSTNEATISTSATAKAPTASVVRSELAALPIKGRAPMTGYSRAQFGPAWPGVDGCDERNDTLARDLTNITKSGLCEVTSGTLVSPYTGATIQFVRGTQTSDLVQIDHVVPLGDAWQTGAQQWSTAKREQFANDPAELLAVDERSNEQKGDADAASWLPANPAFRCSYVSMQVAVKTKYQLWVTQAEHNAIATILGQCGGASPPTRPLAETTPPTVDTSPPTVDVPAPAATKSYVTPGAFCSTAGATGTSETGKSEVCRATSTDSRLRWRSP